MSQHSSATLEAWLKLFLLDLERRGYTERTRDTYRKDLGLFVDWVAAQEVELTRANLERYQLHLMLRPGLQRGPRQGQRLSASTRNRHLAALRSWFRYLVKSGKLATNPAADLECTREPKRLPKEIFTVAEVEALLAAIEPDTPQGLRDLAVVEVLYGTGVRREELLRLSLGDLRLGEGLARIWGKGNKERVVPLGAAAVEALERYLKEGRPRLLQGVHVRLFLSAAHGGPVSHQELARVLKDYARRAGLNKNLTFHLFRHSMATHLLAGGADLRSIQLILGHSQLNTTAIYTRVEISDLQKTLKLCHPRERDPQPDESPPDESG